MMRVDVVKLGSMRERGEKKAGRTHRGMRGSLSTYLNGCEGSVTYIFDGHTCNTPVAGRKMKRQHGCPHLRRGERQPRWRGADEERCLMHGADCGLKEHTTPGVLGEETPTKGPRYGTKYTQPDATGEPGARLGRRLFRPLPPLASPDDHRTTRRWTRLTATPIAGRV